MASSYQTSPMTSNYNSHKKSLSNGTKIIHQTQVVVVVVPFPAQGHLNQLLHLSRLISSYNIPIHFVGTTQHNRQAIVRVQGWDPKSISKNIHIHDFKVPTFMSPPPNPNAKLKFPSHLFPSFQASTNLREHVATLLKSLSSVAKRVVVIYDSLMASCIQDAIHIKNCESYTFHSVSAFTMFLYFWDLMGRPQVKKSKNLIPEVPSLEGCFTTQFINFITSQYQFHKFSNGVIYNTTRVIEKPYIELIEGMISNKTHWALGPFNPLCIEKKTNNKGRHFSLEWLDKQKGKSVIYVSFGTTTAFKEEQIIELANGLEQSKQKFIWVLRDADRGDVFNEDGGVRRIIELPKGFEERVENEGIGLIVRDWAPQLEILSHSSIGGFMSHCGWNSCMESITMGVPIAAWPMHSDQPRNRVLVTEVLKVGLIVKDWSHRDELVKACVVENVVRRLMSTKEGNEMRQNAMNLRIEILKSMDEGGVSRIELDSFIAHVTR